MRCAAELAQAHGLAVRLGADGSFEIVGRLCHPDKALTVAVESFAGRKIELAKPESVRSEAPPDQSLSIQRAIRNRELMAMKEVAYEVGVSIVTLWRASRCNLPGFPAPIVVRRKVYWRRSDLAILEDSLMYYKGRGDFERRRGAAKTNG
jgi:predicted DNA-binding transcriptional regulator AlpA